MSARVYGVRETTDTHSAVAGPLPDITRVEALRQLLAAHVEPSTTVEDVSTTWYSVVARAFRRGSLPSSGNY